MDNNSETKPSEKPVLERNYDLVLDLLMSVATSDPSSVIPITLNVGGWMISGHIIGQEEYLKGFMFGILDQGIKKGVEVLKERGEWVEREETDDTLPEFIHLKNAKFYQPGQLGVPHGVGVLWRGRVAAVDGYIAGTLSLETRPA